MNKNMLLVVGLVVLLLIGGAAFMMKSKNATPPAGTPASTTTTQTNPGTAAKSLKDLLSSGVAQKCTFSDNTANTSMTGTTYIASGKMRGDINTTVNGKETVTHMILNGNTDYIWMNNETTGFKMSFDPQNIDTKGTQQTGVDMTKTMDYKCSPGAVDSSLFTPPAEVKFTDYGTFTIPSGTQNPPGQEGNAAGCSACNSLSGESKTQCLTALKCN